MKILSLIIFVVVLSSNSCESKNSSDLLVSREFGLIIDTLATGLENPWGMAFLPDGRILIAERPGRLRVFTDGKLLDTPVQGIPEIWHHGQGGLMDVVLHPQYEQNGWIYLA